MMRASNLILPVKIALAFSAALPMTSALADKGTCESTFQTTASAPTEVRTSVSTALMGRSRAALKKLDAAIAERELRDRLLNSGINDVYPVTTVKIEFTDGSASLMFREIPGTDAIIIDSIYISEPLRGWNISERLYKLALDQVPQTRRILAFLTLTNKAAYDELRFTTRSERFRHTPGYRTPAKLGFTEIDHLSEVWIEGNIVPFAILRKP